MLVANNILVNPQSGSSHIAPRGMIISQLTMQTQEAMGSGRINLLGCKKETNKKVLVYLQLMSSKSIKIKYDIILEFDNVTYGNGGITIDGVFKDKTPLRVYSNSPEFVFTYAYAFNKRNYLVGKYKHSLGPAISQEPKVKNPNSDIGMSTSLFVALRYLEFIGFYGNYNYARFINGKEFNPQPFSRILQLHKIVADEEKAKNKLKPKVKKINAKNRYDI